MDYEDFRAQNSEELANWCNNNDCFQNFKKKST